MDLESIAWRNYTIRVVKTKVLISFAVTGTAKLICAFVFAYAKYCFSHDAAHIKFIKRDFGEFDIPYETTACVTFVS